ncbi:MAG: class I SAM-dependent methyltransferase [Verrucomicrobiia bacterium]
MDDRLHRESVNLAHAWMQHDSEMLRDYLISGVEDPRINIQSILLRHFLVVSLFGTRFENVMEDELRFATVMNWALETLEQAAGPEDLRAIQHALERGADDAEGLEVPRFVAMAFKALPATPDGVPVPNFLREWLDRASQENGVQALDDAVLCTFERAWAKALAGEVRADLSVLELACGSANDYRFFERFGLARLIDYTGIDLCEKNVANARAMFPAARFESGNALEVAAPDAAYDCCIAHDLFEHLSLDAMERALDEVCRVTRRSFCLGFFNLHEGAEHIEQPLDLYHWNRLSVPRLRHGLHRRGFQVQVVHVGTFLKWRLSCPRTHNPNAYTLFGERMPG